MNRDTNPAQAPSRRRRQHGRAGRAVASRPGLAHHRGPILWPQAEPNISYYIRLAWILIFVGLIILGGGNGSIAWLTLVVELASVGIIAVAFAGKRTHLPSCCKVEDWLVIALPALALLQTIPLPPLLWTHLHGRDLARDIDVAVFGAALWRPVSLNPPATLRSALAMLPMLAAYAAVRTAGQKRFDAIIDGICIAGVLGAIIAFMQLLFPGASELHFYPLGDYEAPIGFFTNHNHQGTFLLCVFALGALHKGAPAGFRKQYRQQAIVVVALVAVIASVLATGSRTASALMPLAIALALSCYFARPWPTGHFASRKVLIIAGSIALLAIVFLAIVLGGEALLRSLHRGPVRLDQRWDFWPDVLQIVPKYLPFGSGIGTFAQIFAVNEPLGSVSPHYLNHAHNELMEIAMEAGLPGLWICAMFVIRFAQQAWSLWWRSGHGERATHYGRVATIPILLILLHSLDDYPAHTFALSALLGVSWAIMAAPLGPNNCRKGHRSDASARRKSVATTERASAPEHYPPLSA
jgi:O-antigen ligase